MSLGKGAMRRRIVSASALAVCTGAIVLYWLCFVSDGGMIQGPAVRDGSPPRVSRPSLTSNALKNSESGSVAVVANGGKEGIRGEVVDVSGRAMAGVEVRLGDNEATSDADGSFLLLQPEWDPEGRGGTVFATKSGFAASQVPVRRDHPSRLRIVLSPASEVRGVVVAGNRPVPGARVSLRDAAWTRTVTTAEDGVFSFPEARSLYCEVSASADGFAPAWTEVAPGLTTREVTVWLVPASDVCLFVRDASGTPVVGASVSVSFSWQKAKLMGKSDADGRALRLPRPIRSASVVVHARGFADYSGPVPDNPGGEATVTVTRETLVKVHLVGDDGGVGDWTVALEMLQTEVVPSPGTPQEEAPPESEGNLPVSLGGEMPSPPPTMVVTGRGMGAAEGFHWVAFDGAKWAVFSGAIAGAPYRVVAVRRDALGREVSLRYVVWLTKALGGETQTVNWTPPETSSLEVRTVDSGSGEPVPAMVLIRADDVTAALTLPLVPEGSATRALSIQSGLHGVLDAWVRPGRYTVSAVLGAVESDAVEVLAGAVVKPVVLRLPTALRIRGVLKTVRGAILPGRSIIAVRRGEPHGVFGTLTDDLGTYEIVGVPRGEYDLYAEGARGENCANQPVRQTVPGEAAVVLVSECELKGTVIAHSPGPFYLKLNPVRKGREIRITIGPDGTFCVPGLSPGKWQVDVCTVGGQRIAGTAVDLMEDVTVTLREFF